MTGWDLVLLLERAGFEKEVYLADPIFGGPLQKLETTDVEIFKEQILIRFPQVDALSEG